MKSFADLVREAAVEVDHTLHAQEVGHTHGTDAVERVSNSLVHSIAK